MKLRMMLQVVDVAAAAADDDDCCGCCDVGVLLVDGAWCIRYGRVESRESRGGWDVYLVYIECSPHFRVLATWLSGDVVLLERSRFLYTYIYICTYTYIYIQCSSQQHGELC